MKIYLGIVLYNPSNNEIKRIDTYAEIFDKILIFDNSNKKLNYTFSKKCSYYFNNANLGLPINYNKFIKCSIEEKADLLCIMDQDSNFPLNEINKCIQYIKKDHLKEAMYVPVSLSQESESNNQNNHDYVDWAINSGSFLNIQLFKNYKLLYDEKLFLDGVDKEMALTIKLKNLKIKRISDAFLYQTLGYTINKHICHSAIRHFYIAESRAYITKKHFYNFRGYVFFLLKLFYHLLSIILYEDDKSKKILFIIKGTRKGMKAYVQ